MSSATSALKSTKSIVDSYVSSSSERSDLTTSFTENTVSSDVNLTSKNGIMNYFFNIVKHPKFKWAVIAVLLCICVFIYFRTQNKEPHTNKNNENNIDISVDAEGRPFLIDKKEKEYMDKLTELEIKEKQLQDRINKLNADSILNNKTMNIPKNKPQRNIPVYNQQPMNIPVQHQAPKVVHREPEPEPQHQHQPQEVKVENRMDQVEESHRLSEESDSSSEEVFIEHENVMSHNLTVDEMNAIDKQLEDVNINEMAYGSD